jgi:hypothetical protein
MDRPIRLRCACLALIGGLLTGCAATRFESPPEVVPQPPPDTTASEVVAEQRETAAGEAADREEAAEALDAAEAAAESTAPAPVPVLAVAVPPKQQAQRFRPTGLTVEEVRRQNAEAPLPLDFGQRVDSAHDRMYAWTQRVVEATDRRFADPDRPLRPVPAAPFRLGLVGEWIDRSTGQQFDLQAEFDIALSLPNLERRLRVFITSGGLDEAPRSTPGSQGLRAGLRYPVLRFLDFDLGVRVDVPPVAFASLKWTREIGLGGWDFFPFAKVFAETKESVGYAAAATFDRWTGRHLLRSSTYAKWRADRDRTQWSHTLIYARAHELLVPERHGSYPRANDIGRGWGLRLLAGGETAHTVDHYETGFFFRRPAPNRWLYWSVEPLVRWDREYGWAADPGVRVGVEMLFWDLARPARR